MKKSLHPAEPLALILATALCAFPAGLAAQSGGNAQHPDQQQQAQQESKTYTGTIHKLTNGQYALVSGQKPDGKLSGHFLDDQDNAKKYEGKQVKVTGTFDTASNTIHVTKIEAA